jgi:protein-S-isoprenylcysteine O-methyltransferase Ste14
VNIRKIIYLFLVAVFLSIVFVGIPLLLIFLNNYFDLLVYTNLYLKIIGATFLTVGFGVVVYSTILHIKTGRITPLLVIEQPKQFIANGLYKYCRNPMYLTEIFIFLGLFFLLGYILLLLYPMVFFLIIRTLVVYVEEPELRRVFGEQYIKYTKKVPRWIPKIVNLF